MYGMLSNIWQYREFILSCVKRDFLEKYKGSIMGIAWSVFQPLAMIVVYTVIFSSVMQSRLPGMETTPYSYSIYLCAGVLPWGMFCEVMLNCANVFLSNGNLMKKVSFPRICLPTITICSAFLNFIVGFVLFLVFMLIIGRFPWHSFPAVSVVLFVQLVLAASIGVWCGVMNVFFRDVGQLLGIVLQFWFWFTPIVYPAKIIPEELVGLLQLNPVYHIINGYQTIFLYDQVPDMFSLAMVLLLAGIIGLYALVIYRRHVGEMVDEL